MGNAIDVTDCDTMCHFVTPKVFQFNGPGDGRRHGRGTYLFGLDRVRRTAAPSSSIFSNPSAGRRTRRHQERVTNGLV